MGPPAQVDGVDGSKISTGAKGFLSETRDEGEPWPFFGLGRNSRHG